MATQITPKRIKSIQKEVQKALSNIHQGNDIADEIQDIQLIEDEEDASYYSDSKTKKTKESKKSTIEETLELWKQKVSIYEIAKQRKLTPQTIYNHFTKLIQMEIVQLSDILPEDKISDLKAAFKEFKGESLGEIKEIHGDKFSWDELRLYKASLN